MAQAAFVAGDWGTTHLRLSLCADDGSVLDTKTGPGIAAARGSVAAAFLGAVEGWPTVPAVLSGMVGSSIGWHEVAYLDCPVAAASIALGALHLSFGGREIVLVPGLACENILGAPDRMRGEETQILGALRGHRELCSGRQFLCLPGTHTKWVVLRDGVIEHFLTSLAGEAFDILSKHSILASGLGGAEGDGFALGLARSAASPDADLLHLLFEVRSRQLAGTLTHGDARSFLSGLIVGRDVVGARRIFGQEILRVHVIGASQLAALYMRALHAQGLDGVCFDGVDASRAGLFSIHSALFAGVEHAH
jgi:2-dehydro-3-deoxygalactonokinase